MEKKVTFFSSRFLFIYYYIFFSSDQGCMDYVYVMGINFKYSHQVRHDHNNKNRQNSDRTDKAK